MTLRIRNWKRFQHFKDRRPPWVKLYRDLLDDPDWNALDGDSAKVITMLWLLASEDPDGEGKLPSLKKIAFRLRMEESALSDCISKLSEWLIQGDITVISEGYQLGPPETETETELETETDLSSPNGDSPRAEGGNGALPPCPVQWIVDGYNEVAARVGMPKAAGIPPARRTAIRARWKEVPERESWENFWWLVEQQPFLAGSNDRNWTANLDWLLRPSNFMKVVERTYDR